MDITTTFEGETVRIRLAGELDALTVPRFVPVLESLLQAPQRRWVLDLARLRMIDGSGMGAIGYGFRKVRELGGAMCIEGATEQPLSIFRLLRLDRVLKPASP
jgi:anti-sigma B factor antagonist